MTNRLAGGPIIPNFGQGDSCVTGDHVFCWSWVREHWGDTLQPRLVEHVELTLIAVGIGFALDRAGGSYALGVIGCGMVAFVAGCVLVWIRSRMPAP